MALLPAQGVMRWNAFDFGPYVRTVTFDQRPVPTPDGRSVECVETRVAVEAYLTGTDRAATDILVDAAKRSLNKFGGVLEISGHGLGDIQVNRGTVRDIAWGPKAQNVRFTPHGGITTKLTFELVYRIPECSSAAYQYRPSAFSTEVTWAIAPNGLTTRTISGVLKIPLTRSNVGSRKVSDSADEYRELCEPARLPGFRRTMAPFVLSPDRTELRFSFTDEEFARSAPPPGVVDYKADMDFASVGKSVMTYMCNLRASYEVMKGYDRRIALVYFLKLAKYRIDKMKASGVVAEVIFQGLTVAEPEVHGTQTARFSLTTLVVLKNPGSLGGFQAVKTFFFANGMWDDPPPDLSDWHKWEQSVRPALGSRGLAGMAFDFRSDRIVDLCGGDVAPPTDYPKQTSTLVSVPVPNLFPPPNPGWLDYQCAIRLEEESGVAEMRSLPFDSLDPFPKHGSGVQAGLPGSGIQVWGPSAPKESKNAPKDVQRRLPPSFHVYVTGTALRVNIPILSPRLAQVKGLEISQANRKERGEGFTTAVVANWGWPVFAAKWNLRYAITGEIPAGLKLEDLLPANPLLGFGK